MTDRADSYQGWHHLVWRNLTGLACALAMLAGVWFSASDAESWPWRLGVGTLFGALAWVGALFVTAKGA